MEWTTAAETLSKKMSKLGCFKHKSIQSGSLRGYKKSVPKFSITTDSLKTNVMHKYGQIIIICASVLISIAIFASHNYTKVIFKMHAPPMQCKATTTMLK